MDKYNKDKSKLSYWSGKKAKIVAKSKRMGISCDLTSADVKELRNSSCYYCDTKNKVMTINRRDETIGYTKDNCITACLMCNKIKRMARLSHEEMIKTGTFAKELIALNPMAWRFKDI